MRVHFITLCSVMENCTPSLRGLQGFTMLQLGLQLSFFCLNTPLWAALWDWAAYTPFITFPNNHTLSNT